MQILWPSLMMRTAVLFQIALKEHIPSSPDNLLGQSGGQILRKDNSAHFQFQFPIFELQD